MSTDHLRSSLQGRVPLGAPLILTCLVTLLHLASYVENTTGPLPSRHPVISLLPRTSSVTPSLSSAPTYRTQRFLDAGPLPPHPFRNGESSRPYPLWHGRPGASGPFLLRLPRCGPLLPPVLTPPQPCTSIVSRSPGRRRKLCTGAESPVSPALPHSTSQSSSSTGSHGSSPGSSGAH